jgi:ubiquinone/menaquinone biosynthesis C-methylase UbiE
MSHTGRFSERAGAYAAARPSYPDAVIDALFEGLGDPSALTVADLGAGTGISARLLAARGAQVYAVEPNGPMRDAALPDPRVTWVDAPAEHTGLDEASCDLVTAFQSFHWFDAPVALSEMVRILRPGGRAARIGYERDESDPFSAAYGEIVRRYQTDDTERRRARAQVVFAQYPAWHTVARTVVPYAQALDRDGLLTRVRSASYLPQSGPVAEELQAVVRALFAQHERGGTVRLALQAFVIAGDVGADGA